MNVRSFRRVVKQGKSGFQQRTRSTRNEAVTVYSTAKMIVILVCNLYELTRSESDELGCLSHALQHLKKAAAAMPSAHCNLESIVLIGLGYRLHSFRYCHEF